MSLVPDSKAWFSVRILEAVHMYTFKRKILRTWESNTDQIIVAALRTVTTQHARMSDLFYLRPHKDGSVF